MAETKILRCASCGASNRVSAEAETKIRSGEAPICGRCKMPLGLVARPVAVTDATFASEVERSPLPVVVDVWAAWCGPCRMIAPVVDELAAEFSGRVRFAKLDSDANPTTSARYQIRSLPTLLVLRGGREVDRLIGVQPKSEIRRRIEQAIA